MLVNNVEGVKNAASMVKSSAFYIELAKFVQAYSMIVLNPNEFLKEVNENPINEKTDHLTWSQLCKILTTCDFGFAVKPTETELVVFYNYALEMGSLGSGAKRVASVEDVANAQKHYYNFIDESTDKAEAEYLKQKQISETRDREATRIDKNLSSIKTKNVVCIIFMFVGALFFAFGLVSVFFDNVIASNIGKIIPIENTHIVGGIIFIVAGICLFAALNGTYLRSKFDYLKLRDASKTIFERCDSSFNDSLVLKGKLEHLKKDLKIVQSELADKTKSSDVIFNIEKLAETNKYYKQFASNEISQIVSKLQLKGAKQVTAEAKLSKEQRENIRESHSEAIIVDAENKEKLSSAVIADETKNAKIADRDESEAVFDEYTAPEESKEIVNEDEILKLKEIEKEEQEERQK